MKKPNRSTAPAISKKAPSPGKAGTKRPMLPREDVSARGIHARASRDEVRTAVHRVVPSRQSNRRPQRSK